MKTIIFFLILIIIVGVALYSVISELKGQVRLDEIKKYFTWSLPTSTPDVVVNVPPPVVQPVIPPPPQEPREPEKPQITPPKGFSLSELSPHYDKIRIENVSPPSSYYWYTALSKFSLRGDYSLSEKVDVTGWRVRGNKKRDVVIPQAVADFGLYNQQNVNVFLEKGSVATFFSSQSPIGKNLRLNKCTGYLNNSYKFDPSLPNNCPSIDRSDVISFSGKCQTFIFSLYGCREPSSMEKNELSGTNDVACRAFLDDLNYGGCYRKYGKNIDFFSGEWYVWMNLEMPFDSAHDRILLFDKQGLLVDEYIY